MTTDDENDEQSIEKLIQNINKETSANSNANSPRAAPPITPWLQGEEEVMQILRASVQESTQSLLSEKDLKEAERRELEAIQRGGEAEMQRIMDELRAELGRIHPEESLSQEAMESYNQLQQQLEELDAKKEQILESMIADREQIRVELENMQRLAEEYRQGKLGSKFDMGATSATEKLLLAVSVLLFLASMSYLVQGFVDDTLETSIPNATIDMVLAALATFALKRVEEKKKNKTNQNAATKD